jgi:predicted O-linked N-acetylglucosamine transferase (SPINDLY family)
MGADPDGQDWRQADGRSVESLMGERRFGEAEALLERQRQERQDDPTLALRHGQCLHELGRLEEAVPCYLRAMAGAPSDPEPLRLLGLLLEQAGDADQAEALYRQAIAVRSDCIESLFCLGRFLSNQARIDEARPLYEAIERLDPQHPAAPFSIGRDARQLGAHDLALARLRQARQLAEGNPQAERWILEALIFLLSIGSAQQVGAYLEATDSYWQGIRKQESAGEPWAAPAHPVAEVGGRRLRIGILCADLGAHVVSSFLAAFLEGYQRDQLEVELIATHLRHEARAETLIAQADGAHSTVGLSSREARELLRRQRYDVIVETAGFTHPANLELLAQRCAPVQCHWIGYHASTGLDTIDWFLGDGDFSPVEFADQFREKLWCLPRPWLARSPSTPPPLAQAEITSEAPVLGSFNQLAKLGEPTLAFWAAALRALPQAQLLIKDRHTSNPSACRRIRESLARREIDPGRLRFLPAVPDWQDHLRTYNSIDIALDATPWSGSSTAFDALAMGVPLVAIRGDCPSARMSTSVLTGMDRREWISDDPTGFAAIVAGLARDLPALRRDKAARQRQALSSCLHDPHDLGRHVGDALMAMHRLAA